MNVFRTKCPIVGFVLCRYGVSALLQSACARVVNGVAFGIHGLPGAFSGIRSSPAKPAESHTFDWHNPCATDEVFLLVYVFDVDTLAVVDSHLVMEEITIVGVLEQIALQLNTDITAIAGVAAITVVESREFQHVLPIRHKALVDGVHRILKGKSPFELADLDICELVFLPFYEQVYNPWGIP